MPRSRIVAVLVLLVALGGLITLPLIATGQRATESPNVSLPTPNIPFYEPPCGSLGAPHYYFGDPNKESPRSFGPSASWDQVNNASIELRYRLCGRPDGTGGDKALYRAITAMAEGTDPNLPLSNSEWQKGVQTLVYSYIEWDKAELVQRTSPKGTYSLYMEKLESGEIKIGTVEVEPRTSWFLKISVFNGIKHVELLLRLPCGFQPEGLRKQIPAALL